MTHFEKPNRIPQNESRTGHSWLADASSLSTSLRGFLAQQEQLCDRLEQIADNLPVNTDTHGCLQTAQGIMPVVKRAHEFEEHTLYPFLLQRAESRKELLATLDRLRFEHLGDEEFGNDLTLTLRQFVISPENCNVESLAWMLRGFFEGLRRHIAFERELLLPLIEKGSDI